MGAHRRARRLVPVHLSGENIIAFRSFLESIVFTMKIPGEKTGDFTYLFPFHSLLGPPQANPLALRLVAASRAALSSSVIT